VPAHWNSDYLACKVGPANVSQRKLHPADKWPHESMLVSLPHAANDSVLSMDQRDSLVVRIFGPGKRFADVTTEVLLEGLSYSHVFLDVMYWPHRIEMARSFLRTVAREEPSSKMAFYFAVVSATRFLEIDKLFPQWDFHDLEYYSNAKIPVHQAYARHIEVRSAEKWGEEYDVFGPAGLQILL
jgi:hypothetical protein